MNKAVPEEELAKLLEKAEILFRTRPPYNARCPYQSAVDRALWTPGKAVQDHPEEVRAVLIRRLKDRIEQGRNPLTELVEGTVLKSHTQTWVE